MNPNISNLHQLPRGRAWRSSLVPFSEDIARAREKGESYSQIVQMLRERGVEVSLSAVHAFVRVRARQKRVQYALPDATRYSNAESRAGIAPPTPDRSITPPTLPTSIPSDRVVRYVPPARKTSKFRPGDLACNGPFPEPQPSNVNEKQYGYQKADRQPSK